MAARPAKRITVTILDQEHIRKDWFFDFNGAEFAKFFDGLSREMKKLGVELKMVHNKDILILVNSYSDLLNSVRVTSADDGHCNQCVGHIIGKSEKLDITDDIRAAVRRIAFAPETIAPASEFRKVCHNCGCGC